MVGSSSASAVIGVLPPVVVVDVRLRGSVGPCGDAIAGPVRRHRGAVSRPHLQHVHERGVLSSADEGNPVDDPGTARREAPGHLLERGHDGECVEDVVVDEPGHLRPPVLLGEPRELGPQITPAVEVEDRFVRRRRRVEGEMRADGGDLRFHFCFGPGGEEDGGLYREPFHRLAGPAAALGQSRHRALTDPSPGGEAMAEKSVGDFACHTCHGISHPGEVDRRRSESVPRPA